MKQVEADEFDFIVVGGGSAGAAVAARLAERADLRVLLLEAGRQQSGIRFRLPILTPFALAKEDAVWNFTTLPEPGLNGRELVWPRGRGLGGSSLINGMLWVRGDPVEYDLWAASGCTGWSYGDLLDFFKRSETYIPGDPASRGQRGAVTVTRHRPADPLSDAFLKACGNMQVSQQDDYNAGISEGAGYLQFNQRRGLRHGTDRAYLSPASRCANLTIREGAVANRILFEGKRAIGVEYRAADGLRCAIARREVVLSCGTVQSPKLLELSGIGDGEVLGRAGIVPLVHLPGVGENLRDHLNVRVGFRTRFRGTLNDVQHSYVWKVRAMLCWLARGGGPLSTIGATAHAFVRTRSDLERADVKIQMLHFSAPHNTGNISGRLDEFPGFSISTFVLRPNSTGSSHIRSGAAAEPPAIVANYLSHEEDLRSMLGAFRFINRIASDSVFDDLMVSRDNDLAGLQSDQDILEWAKTTGLTSYHPIGTCKMGTDSASVVDPRLRVIGVDGLRVVDASVMPTMPSSNTHGPTVMIGEKGAAMILEDSLS
ncbi:GMC family oxidoreductase [Agrobacterium rhizogenes]|uniref:GMC oxidoreductase n=14 Tax=Rhizobium/Agrobacterium group TaxID=227290 RepID=A0A2Z2PR59_AGRFC|nr:MULTISPECIES: GMC family oxidoreductase [Rhizobium/Agrobacterium group]ACM31067.1 dehydrogenase oxidoreductase [Rhizobium rhizogenes K84]AYD04969.1 choline dehydrogenase [Neorhizobium sp. NCHU2750]KJF70740.1 GMC oxidoreductase [Agrobacterium arsenijevicii]OCJ08330.1 GMC oxidoreductase [Agrobacterium sp. B131/95]OCJ28651.1 GMC oxidoreductase [Agrobacterium sp. B133/95]